MSGLLGPMVAPGITPDSGQGQLATAISSFFGGGTPQFQTPTPQAPAPAPDPTYDKWGHVVTRQPAGADAAGTGAKPCTLAQCRAGVGTSGRTRGRRHRATTCGAGRRHPHRRPQAGAPQLPGLADIMKLIQDYQAQQALLNANNPQGLLASGMGEGTSGMGGDRGADTSASSAGGGGPEGSGTANW